MRHNNKYETYYSGKAEGFESGAKDCVGVACGGYRFIMHCLGKI